MGLLGHYEFKHNLWLSTPVDFFLNQGKRSALTLWGLNKIDKIL